VLQGFFGFVLGVIATALLLTYQPQLIGDLHQGFEDAREGALHLAHARDDVTIGLSRPFEREGDQGETNNDGNGRESDNGREGTRSSYDRDAYERDTARSPQDLHDGQESRQQGSSGDYGAYDDRGSDTRGIRSNFRDQGGRPDSPESVACRGVLSIENRTDRTIESRISAGRYDGRPAALGNDGFRVELRPGEHVERTVRVMSPGPDCDGLNTDGALTLVTETCPVQRSNQDCSHGETSLDLSERTASAPERTYQGTVPRER
jgi:hypothetical protein